MESHLMGIIMKSVFKLSFLSVIILALVILCATLSAPAQTSEKGHFYRIKIAKEILTDPHAMAAWRIYGQFKQEWRDSIFFRHYPDEDKYRFTYKEELDCRKRLAEYWITFKKANPGVENRYLDDLVKAFRSVYFPEYVYKYFNQGSWNVKKDRFRLKEFKKWVKLYIKGHQPKTLAHLEEVDF
jgi:hypothetical protein